MIYLSMVYEWVPIPNDIDKAERKRWYIQVTFTCAHCSQGNIQKHEGQIHYMCNDCGKLTELVEEKR